MYSDWQPRIKLQVEGLWSKQYEKLNSYLQSPCDSRVYILYMTSDWYNHDIDFSAIRICWAAITEFIRSISGRLLTCSVRRRRNHPVHQPLNDIRVSSPKYYYCRHSYCRNDWHSFFNISIRTYIYHLSLFYFIYPLSFVGCLDDDIHWQSLALARSRI